MRPMRSWYVRHRAAKREDLATARALHTRLLQRQGCEHWLRVGLAWRQQRLGRLATSQACPDWKACLY